jgi:hypothetical protein
LKQRTQTATNDQQPTIDDTVYIGTYRSGGFQRIKGLLAPSQPAFMRKPLCLRSGLMKFFFTFLSVLFIVLISISTGPGCANIVPPQGGPRDTLPPVLLDANPNDSTLNFRGDRITLTFDEYVDLTEVQNNILFTPTMDEPPEVQVRLKTIVVRLRDTLDPNTTYIFNFGNAVRDFNEGNVLRNYVYTFSTGPALDSLEVTGKVVMAETGAVDTTLVVLLHRSLDDSAVRNQAPRYVTRVNSAGNFTFKNLPAGTFAIYALGDAGIARRYQSATQAFAFADSPMVVRSGTAPVTLYAYKERPPAAPPAVAAASPARGGRAATDNNRLRFTSNVVNGAQQDLLQDLVMSFEQPLRTLDSTSLSLTTDSSFQPVAYSLQLDSSRKILTIKTPWIENKLYNLITAKDFAEDSLGRKLLKSDTVSFTTRKTAEYGALTIRLKGIDSILNPVLQLVQNGAVMSSVPVQSGVYTQPLFAPGEYDLRILSDRNNNGVWDPGRFFGTRLQPELVRPVERRITVKASFANDFEIVL